ncbi:MAG: hypothetical protein EOO24_03230 [Comamonadaceae bacterium]|nr:MAG: hypothetical protein EOO24_03230 [Comamonadaceae bacterium]
MLAGCAADPARLNPGTSRDEALRSLGPPSASYPLGNGQRLQYSRLPAGFEVTNVDLDAAGRVVSVRQELDERWFGGTIRPGVWNRDDVLRTYGRPYEITAVSSFDGAVWTWRYKAMNNRRLLFIYIDRQGVVQRYSVGDELFPERFPR